MTCDQQEYFDVNFFGVAHGSKVFAKSFIEQGKTAAIYNVGSENSLFHGTPLNGAYVATKHGVFAMTQSLYEELPDFIDVSLRRRPKDGDKKQERRDDFEHKF